MTIRFLKPWNGYQPDQLVAGLTNEAALIAGGLASDDLDGGNDGRSYEAKFLADVSGSVTGLVGPDGRVYAKTLPAENTILVLGDSIPARSMHNNTISSATFSGTQMTLNFASTPNGLVGGNVRLFSRTLLGSANAALEGVWPVVGWSATSVTVELGFNGTGLNPGTSSVFFDWGYGDTGWLPYAASAAKLAGKPITWNIQAVGGDRTSDLVKRLPGIIADDSSNRAVVHIGINDVLAHDGSTITVDTIVANYEEIFRLLLDAGYLIDVVSIWPLGSGHASYASKTTYIKQLNGYLRQKCLSTTGMSYVDQWAALIDGSNDYALAINLAADAIHGSPKGAQLAGAAYYTAMATQLQKATFNTVRSAADGYDITPTGWNLIRNPLLTGTGGTAGTGVTGNIPDNWTVNRSGGDSCVCALSAHSTGIGQDLQVTHNRSSATQNFTIEQDVTTQCLPGTTRKAGCEIEITEDEGSGTHYLIVMLSITTPTGEERILAGRNAQTYANNGRVPATGTRYWYETPEVAIPTAATAVVFKVLVTGGSVGDGTSADQTAIKFAKPMIE